MAITEVTRYQTSDGKLHETEHQAALHELTEAVLDKIGDALALGDPKRDGTYVVANDVLNALTSDSGKAVRALLDFHDSLRKRGLL